MTVYVDNAFIPAKVGRLDSRWCHMTADTTEELIAFAVSIGLQARYIQFRGHWKEHFDVTAGKRRQAVANGAVEVSRRESVEQLLAKRRTFDAAPELHLGSSGKG